MNKLHKLILPLLGIITISCAKSGVNKEFRENVLPTAKIQKDTLAMFDKILDKLDEKNVKFSEYYNKTRYKIPDSCDEVILKKYGEISNNTDELYQMTIKAQENYSKKLKIDEKEEGIINSIGVLNIPVKKYLSKEIGIDMYNPEEEVMESSK